MDRLQDLFELQKRFQFELTGLKPPIRDVDQVKNSIISMIAEIGEILEEYQYWKYWRRKPPIPDNSKLLIELVDLWHFVINLTLYLGFDYEELYLAFIKKNEINFRRQEEDY